MKGWWVKDMTENVNVVFSCGGKLHVGKTRTIGQGNT